MEQSYNRVDSGVILDELTDEQPCLNGYIDDLDTGEQFENQPTPERPARRSDRSLDIDPVNEQAGYTPKTRELKQNYKRGYTGTGASKGARSESPVKLFTRRTAQILDVSEREVPELLVNSPSKAFRINNLRFDPEMAREARTSLVAETMAAAEVDTWTLDWFDEARIFEASDTATVQSQDIATDGKVFIQNPSSYLPVFALDPAKGRSILDMCSAPGGKAALIASLAAEQGQDIRLYANEPKGRRMQKLKDVLGTLGVVNAELLEHDGKHLPNLLGKGIFDRILVDAECSTEAGINFASRNPLKDWSMERVQRVSVLQKQLVTAAYDMLEPGGVLVYSTCTLSPEENEGVISALTQRRRDAVIQPISFTAEENGKKVKSWQGQRYSSEVYNRCLRIFPNDYMEGFFVARIRKPTGIKDIDDTYEDVVSLEKIARPQ